jgi:hypothetical protein
LELAVKRTVVRSNEDPVSSIVHLGGFCTDQATDGEQWMTAFRTLATGRVPSTARAAEAEVRHVIWSARPAAGIQIPSLVIWVLERLALVFLPRTLIPRPPLHIVISD